MAAWGFLAEVGGYGAVFTVAIILLAICGVIGFRALKTAK
jgi:hypothetical protein